MRKPVDVTKLTEEQVLEMAKAEGVKVGYEVLEMKKLERESDNYLRYVLCHSEKKREYATWLFNVEMGGFHHGHYHIYWNGKKQEEVSENAKKDFDTR